MAAPPASAKFALFLLLYPPLLGALFSLLLWAWDRLKGRPPSKGPLLVEASSTAAFFVGGALSLLLGEEQYALIHVSLPRLPLLSFRLDALTGGSSLGAAGMAALGTATGEREAPYTAARLALLSAIGFCSTCTGLPLLVPVLVFACFVAVAASEEGGSKSRVEEGRLRAGLALRLFLLACGLALVGGGLRLVVAWCDEGDMLALSDLTGYMPLGVLLRALKSLSIGAPLAFLLPFGGRALWATPLLAQSAVAVLARLTALSLPAGAGEACALCPALAMAVFLVGWALIAGVEKGGGERLGTLRRGLLLLGLLCALQGRPPVAAAGMVLVSAVGLALSVPTRAGWRGTLHRLVLLGVPPFVVSSALWLVAVNLWRFGGATAWPVTAGLAWATAAVGTALSRPTVEDKGAGRAELAALLFLALLAPLPVVGFRHVMGSLMVRV